jgi:hypothetical protein
MDPTPMDRPRSTTPHQQSHQTHPRPTPTAKPRPTINTRRSMNKSDHESLRVSRDAGEHRHTINTGGDGSRQPNLNVQYQALK